MKRKETEKIMKDYPVWTHHNLAIMTDEQPSYIARQVSEWREKGWLIKLKRGVYVPANLIDKVDRLILSSWIVDPSYVSCESAMSYYGMIPEVSYVTTGVSPTKSQTYVTPLGDFSYRYISSKYFRGRKQKDHMYIARPEKALLDYCRLYKDMLNENTVRSLRLHFSEEFSTERFMQYLHKRDIKTFIKKVSLYIVPYLVHDGSTS